MKQFVALSAASVLTVFGAGACSSTPAETATAESGSVSITLPRCVAGAGESGSACIVRVFDGAVTSEVRPRADGRWLIEVPRDNVADPRIAFYSAPGFEPQVRALAPTASDQDQVTLAPRTDPRGGYLVGVVFRKTEKKMDGSACGIDSFLSGKSVIVNRVRARFVAQTDNIGSFKLALPAGRYQMHVDDTHQPIDVPRGDTVFVALPVNQ
jgi:hypothetical protein